MKEQLVIIRYEDMVFSLKALEPVFHFCSITARKNGENFLHQNSIQKWRDDESFCFSLAPSTIELAEMYGYPKKELIKTPPRSEISKTATSIKKQRHS